MLYIYIEKKKREIEHAAQNKNTNYWKIVPSSCKQLSSSASLLSPRMVCSRAPSNIHMDFDDEHPALNARVDEATEQRIWAAKNHINYLVHPTYVYIHIQIQNMFVCVAIFYICTRTQLLYPRIRCLCAVPWIIRWCERARTIVMHFLLKFNDSRSNEFRASRINYNVYDGAVVWQRRTLVYAHIYFLYTYCVAHGSSDVLCFVFSTKLTRALLMHPNRICAAMVVFKGVKDRSYVRERIATSTTWKIAGNIIKKKSFSILCCL